MSMVIFMAWKSPLRIASFRMNSRLDMLSEPVTHAWQSPSPPDRIAI